MPTARFVSPGTPLVTEGISNTTAPILKNTREKSKRTITGGFFDNFWKKLFKAEMFWCKLSLSM